MRRVLEGNDGSDRELPPGRWVQAAFPAVQSLGVEMQIQGVGAQRRDPAMLTVGVVVGAAA